MLSRPPICLIDLAWNPALASSSTLIGVVTLHCWPFTMPVTFFLVARVCTEMGCSMIELGSWVWEGPSSLIFGVMSQSRYERTHSRALGQYHHWLRSPPRS